jgi:hypothetical protein
MFHIACSVSPPGHLTAGFQGLRVAYCDNVFEKTKPICLRANRLKLLCERNLWQNIALRSMTKQIQFIRAEYCVLRAAYCDDEFEKTKPILAPGIAGS